MGMAEQILTAARNSAIGIDGACMVRFARGEWEALCTGLDEIRAATDQGMLSGYNGNVRYAASAELRPVLAGDVIEIKRTADAKYIRVRVGSRHQIGGAVRLTIAAEFE
jgi:hypothetical protein